MVVAQVVERLLSTPEIPGLNTVFGNLFTFNCIKKTKLKKKVARWGVGLLVMGDDSCSRGRGFESRCHIDAGWPNFENFCWQFLHLFSRGKNSRSRTGMTWRSLSPLIEWPRHRAKRSSTTALLNSEAFSVSYYLWFKWLLYNVLYDYCNLGISVKIRQTF